MKITFLGVESPSSYNNAESNLLVESGAIKMCIDCGRGAFASVEQYGLSLKDITHVLITHLHSDNVSGLEEAAFMTLFVHKFKVQLLATPTLLQRLWDKTLKGGLEFIEEAPGSLKRQSLDDYFDLIELSPNDWNSIGKDLRVFLHPTDHVKGMESYGVEVEKITDESKKRFLYSGDTKFSPDLINHGFKECSHIFHDCQLSDQGGIALLRHHATYDQLLELPLEVRKKMWLYHYQDGNLPDAQKDGFAGFAQHLQSYDL